MQLKIIISSSQGNSYILESDTEALVIECGVKMSRIKKALCFNISKIVGCLCSHMHLGHSKEVPEFVNNAIPVLAVEDVFTSKGISLANPFAKVIRDGEGYKMGNFKMLHFNAEHDVKCDGFHIYHPVSGNILFLTDSSILEYTFPNHNHILIEINYAQDILDDNIRLGNIYPGLRPEIMNDHMELETCKKILLANDLQSVINIVLSHVSSGNSYEGRFIREVREATGKRVFKSKKRMELEFDINPY